MFEFIVELRIEKVSMVDKVDYGLSCENHDAKNDCQVKASSEMGFVEFGVRIIFIQNGDFFLKKERFGRKVWMFPVSLNLSIVHLLKY